jgi:hypothetical protein
MTHPKTSWLTRIAWLVAIWAGSVAALGMAALLFRSLMSLAGMTA